MNFVTLNDSNLTLEEVIKAMDVVTGKRDSLIIAPKNRTIHNKTYLDKTEYQLYTLLKTALEQGDKFSLDVDEDELSINNQLKTIINFLTNEHEYIEKDIELYFCYETSKINAKNYEILFRIKSERIDSENSILRIDVDDMNGIIAHDRYEAILRASEDDDD